MELSETKLGKLPRVNCVPKLTFLPRRPHVSPAQPVTVKPLHNEQETKNESLLRESRGTSSLLSKLSTSNIPIHSSSQTSASIFSSEHKDSDGSKIKSNKVPRRPWTKQKIVICVLSVIAIVLACAAVATLPPLFLIVLRSSSTSSSVTNINASVCSTQTCIAHETPFRTSMLTVLYPFYGNTLDVGGSLTGTALGLTNPSYTMMTWTATNSLAFTANNQQYVNIPYVNIAKQSFTIELWAYPMSNGGQVDFGMFGECGSDSICFSLSIRNGRVTVLFDSLNNNSAKLVGSTILTSNWVHIAVTYDAVRYQQIIYINGQVDAMSTGMVYPYQGTSTGATAAIAVSSSLGYQPSFFNGNIGLFSISAGVARSACQVSNDATLSAYYPFDASYTVADHGVNLLNGYASGITVISSGRVQEAILLSQNTSFFQAPCFTNTRAANPSFLVSLWIYPTAISGGSIVHVSSGSQGNGTYCFDLLSLTSAGVVVAQLQYSATGTVVIYGPTILANTWTHLAVAYSSSSSFQLFVNAQPYIIQTSSIPNWPYNNYVNALYVTLGNNSPQGPTASLNCPSNSSLAIPGSYKGVIDEFRLFNRQLSTDEICALANP